MKTLAEARGCVPTALHTESNDKRSPSADGLRIQQPPLRKYTCSGWRHGWNAAATPATIKTRKIMAKQRSREE